MNAATKAAREHLEVLIRRAAPADAKRILQAADAYAATYAIAETDRELGRMRLEIAAAEYGSQKRRAA